MPLMPHFMSGFMRTLVGDSVALLERETPSDGGTSRATLATNTSFSSARRDARSAASAAPRLSCETKCGSSSSKLVLALRLGARSKPRPLLHHPFQLPSHLQLWLLEQSSPIGFAMHLGTSPVLLEPVSLTCRCSAAKRPCFSVS